MIELRTENVDKIFKDCLIEGISTVEEAKERGGLEVRGVRLNTFFDPIKLEQNKDDILSMLSKLDSSFYKEGNSFLQLCTNSKNELWSSFHRQSDALLCLGIAIGAVQFCVQREDWDYLPGRMPYLKININPDK